MAFLADKYKIYYFRNLQNKMNERKLKKLLHFLGIFEISQNWSFLRFPHLTSWRLLWPREVLFEVWLMQPSCWKGSIAQSLTRRFHLGAWRATVHGVAKLRHDLATKPPPPQYLQNQWTLSRKGQQCHGTPGGIEKQICKGCQGDVKHVRKAGRAWIALAQSRFDMTSSSRKQDPV